MIRRTIRRACQSGLLGFCYPSDFPIKACLQWRACRHERATVRYLRAALHSGDVFVDVGAHVGYYAAIGAHWVGRTGRVFAFEPHPDNYRLLVRNSRSMPQIAAVQAAVSDSGGHALLFEHSASSSSHALADIGGNGRGISVRTVSIDEWAREKGVRLVNAVLIDVEGHEFEVLRGMSRLVADNPGISIIMEYCPSHRTARHEGLQPLLEEIRRQSLRVTAALGQSREYAVPAYASETELNERLVDIVLGETAQEHCNYINLVARRCA